MKHAILSLLFIALSAVLQTPASATPQETSPKKDEVSSPMAHPVARALAMAATGEIALTGAVRGVEPEKGPVGNGKIGQQVFMLRVGGGIQIRDSANEFRGSIECMRTKSGETIIVSERVLPGFVLYRDGGVELCESLQAKGKAIQLGPQELHLRRMVDFEALLLQCRDAEWRELSDPGLNRRIFRGKLQLSFFAPENERDELLYRRIKEAEITVEVQPDSGELMALNFELAQEDAWPAGLGKNGAGKKPPIPRVAYSFRRKPQAEATERLKRALERMREVRDTL